MGTAKKIWKIFPPLAKVTRRAHIDIGMANGHDFDHALSVAQIALFVAESHSTGRLAGAAGLCHNADRIIAKLQDMKIWLGASGEEGIRHLAREWLCQEARISSEERDIILGAVIKHSRPNENDDDEVTVALKDADRISCLDLNVLIRAGQFHPNLPLLDPNYLLGESINLPHEKRRGRYNERPSVLEDLRDCLDWADTDDRFCVRLPKSRKLAFERAELLRSTLDKIIKQREEFGLVPYPF